MTKGFVQYEPQDQYIHNWLVAGPQVLPGDDQLRKNGQDYGPAIAKKYFTEKQEILIAPVERGPLTEGVFKIDAFQADWSYFECGEDHLVDLSASFPTCSFIRAWAYSLVTVPAVVASTFTLTTSAPVDLWINKKLVLHHEQFSDQPDSLVFSAALIKGINKILVRFTGVAVPEAVLAFSLKTDLPAGAAQVQIPTLIPTIERRAELEEVYKQVYIERDIYTLGDYVTLRWPEQLDKPTYADVRLQTQSGRIYGQAEEVGKPGDIRKMGNPATLPVGKYQLMLMPRAWEFYESNIRITRYLDFWTTGRYRFSTNPYGSYEERKKEALLAAAAVENDLFGQIAYMALGRWSELEHKTVERAVDEIRQRQAGSQMKLLGLLGAYLRYPDLPENIKEPLQAAALHYVYGDLPSACAGSKNENLTFLSAACQILAGQCFPEAAFVDSGLTGSQMRAAGEAAVMAWMQSRAQQGFILWDSKQAYADFLAGLAHLVDLAAADEVFELAAVLIDKVLFSIALNSYNGVFGSTQGAGSTLDIKSGLLEPTSGITRLLWGMGIFNHHTAGMVSLACMTNYELPPILADIGAGLPEEVWNKEQHAVDGHTVNKVSYRTPDYLLASAQSYQPGQPGHKEHIWQATLGPTCVVFTNHPGCSTENDSHAPNFWLGNATLPRVAQWQDTLIAIYNAAGGAALPFTHAYFPTIEFDEYQIAGSTAFAKKGDGYIALTAANGLELVSTGKTAFRELRSPGGQNIWVCQMGRAALDGDFQAFMAQVQQKGISFDGLQAELATLHGGGQIRFGWDGALMYNGNDLPLTDYPHFENPFTTADLPCSQMEISNGEYLLRLKFTDLTAE